MLICIYVHTYLHFTCGIFQNYCGEVNWGGECGLTHTNKSNAHKHHETGV